jgi:hypothetical protein
MSLLEQQPLHVRKKIALGITSGIGLVLVIAMVFVYSSQKKEVKGADGATTAIGRFYATILSDTQSYFGVEHAIISK